MAYSLPSIKDLAYSPLTHRSVHTMPLPYTITQEQAYKILNHTGALREAETELYKALHHFNSLTLAEQDALEEMTFHDYWVVWISKGMVNIEPMYEAHHGLSHGIAFKCFDRSDAVVLQACISL